MTSRPSFLAVTGGVVVAGREGKGAWLVRVVEEVVGGRRARRAAKGGRDSETSLRAGHATSKTTAAPPVIYMFIALF